MNELPKLACSDDQDLERFWGMLAKGYCSGTQLCEILAGMKGTFQGGPMRRAVEELSVQIAGGSSLSEAMAAQPGVFSRAHVALVEGGERLGIVDRILPFILEATWRCPACTSLRMPMGV